LSQAKSPSRPCYRAWLGLAYFGRAWPGLGLQAEPGTSLLGAFGM